VRERQQEDVIAMGSVRKLGVALATLLALLLGLVVP
jgi:hypothetical protein